MGMAYEYHDDTRDQITNARPVRNDEAGCPLCGRSGFVHTKVGLSVCVEPCPNGCGAAR